ncbi:MULTISPECIES: VWA domain-containing protein [Achromobacter]|uniref:VWA domain-containing protein n=1 Tax=Achromobacter TaxID=222 RepID=UPI0025C1574C|nr:MULTISPECIES: VWA domain-containing protein [Achromobacter]
MEVDLSAFHFLRPWWLLALPVAALLLWLRRESGAAAVHASIAPALLPYLVVNTPGSRGPRPVHLLAALVALGGVAAAGPAWQQDRPAFLDNQAPLIAAVDLSPSMDAADVPPRRLEAVKHKLRDLLARRAGARMGLIAYAGAAHLVLPPTDDVALLDMFVQALSTDLIAAPGKDAAGAITLAASVMQAEQSGGTLLLITDGADTSQFAEIERLARENAFQILVWAAGTRKGGVVLDAKGQPRVDATGKPVMGDFDADGLKRLAQAARAPLGSLALNDDDLDWVIQHAQRHFEQVQDAGSTVHWKDAGYWLCWPLALLALAGLRRGWNVNWTAVLLMACTAGMYAPSANAGPLADAFFTPDQQGRWAYEHQRYTQAAALFQDPYWKGRVAYDAGDYRTALAAFARLQTPEAAFYLGNTQARLRNYGAALAAYDHALGLRPAFPEARTNRELVARLLAAAEAEQEDDDSQKPDDVSLDNDKAAGKMTDVAVAQAASEALWLRNLNLSPGGFLRQKFAIEEARKQTAVPGRQP